MKVLGPLGFAWVPLGPLGSPLGSPWVPLGSPFGPPWIPFGSPWVTACVPLGPPWVPLGPRGSPWVPLGPPFGSLGSPLADRNLCCCSRGPTQMSLLLNVFDIFSETLHFTSINEGFGSPWARLGALGSPCVPLGSPWVPLRPFRILPPLLLLLLFPLLFVPLLSLLTFFVHSIM